MNFLFLIIGLFLHAFPGASLSCQRHTETNTVLFKFRL